MSNTLADISPTSGSLIAPTDTLTLTVYDYLGRAITILPVISYPDGSEDQIFDIYGVGPSPTTPATTFESLYSGSSISTSGSGTDLDPFTTVLTLVRTGGFPLAPTLTVSAINELGEVYLWAASWVLTVSPVPGGNIVVTVNPPAGTVITPTEPIIVTVTDLGGAPHGVTLLVSYAGNPPESPFATFGGGSPLDWVYSAAYSGSITSFIGNVLTFTLQRNPGFLQPPTVLVGTSDDEGNAQAFGFSWPFAAAPPAPALPTSTPLRALASHTYQSISNGQTYNFDVTLDSNGMMAVRNIRGPYGLIADSFTSLPDDVVSNIASARRIMAQQLAEKQVASGTLTFTGQTFQPVVIAPGLLNNTFYRVVYTTPDGTPMYTSEQTIGSFNANVATAYGTSLAPIMVPYVVLAAAQQSSALSGTLTFSSACGGVVKVTFPTAMATDKYRVMLSPNGFFTARIIQQTRTGMAVQLGYTLGPDETQTVGFDIFV